MYLKDSAQIDASNRVIKLKFKYLNDRNITIQQ